jgi:hypothetical protein
MEFLLLEEPQRKIYHYILEQTKLNWNIPSKYVVDNGVHIIEKTTKTDLGYFDCFLEEATFELSYKFDPTDKIIVFYYQSRIKYLGGGTNGFDCRFVFDLDGKLLRKIN